MERAEVYAMVESLADLGTALSTASPERQAQLYQAAKLEIRYELAVGSPSEHPA